MKLTPLGDVKRGAQTQSTPSVPAGREAQTLRSDTGGQVQVFPYSMAEMALAVGVVEQGANLINVSTLVALMRRCIHELGLSEGGFSREELLRKMEEYDGALQEKIESFRAMLEVLDLVSQPDPASTDIPERLRNIEVDRLCASIMDFVTYCRLSHESNGQVICRLTGCLEDFNSCGRGDRSVYGWDPAGWTRNAYERSTAFLGHKPENVRDLIILVRCVPAYFLQIRNFGPKSLKGLTSLLESFCGLGEGELKNLTQDDIDYLKSLA